MNKFVLFCVIVFALLVRTHNIEGKLAFDWDQNRDMEQVTKMMRDKKPALLGPIVKGEAGGFYLGPLYYYVLVPIVSVSGSNPLALSLVSIGCDILLIAALYAYLRKKVSRTVAAFICFAWASSPLIIRMAMVPWNVSFISLWTLAFISVCERIAGEKKYDTLPWLGLLISLTTSIHVSLWPVAVIGVGYIVWFGRRVPGRILVQTVLGLLIPIIPLIVHDLTHQYENLHLLKFFITQGSHGAATYQDMITVVLTKFGYTIGRLVTGEPLTWLGLALAGIAIIHSFIQRKGKDAINLTVIAIVLGSLVYYRNTDFAEYYMTATFVPLFLLMAYLMDTMYRHAKVLTGMVILILTIFAVHMGWQERMNPGSPYSLMVKKALVSEIHALGYPVEVRRTLPKERDTGFPYLMASQGFSSDPTAARKVYIYETKNMEIVSPPEARSVIYEKSQGAFKFVVFSN